MNAEKKYLFVLCGPYSGSTALWKLLSTSSNVSSFHTEGQQLESLKNILFTSDRWDPEKSIPWQKVKECWEGEWDLKKPVLLEKSPAHLCRALKIEKFFPNSFFIIMYRDPYASAEAFKRRHGWDCKRAAEFWIQVMKCQQKNIENLKENIHFSYEDFTGDPETVCRKIVEFMPELGDMDLKTKLKSHYREEKVKNYNDIQILNLNSNDIKKINSVLHSSRDIMGYFKYQYIEPGLLRDFNYAAFRCYNLVKRMIKKLAFRRVGAYTVYKKK